MGLELILLAILSFIVGFFVKIVDFIEDDLKGVSKKSFLKRISPFLGIIYGALIILVIVLWPILIPLALGVVFGEFWANKIDAPGHKIAIVALIVLSVLLLLFGGLNVGVSYYFIGFFVIFFASSLIDEYADKYMEKQKKSKSIFRIFAFRPVLEVVSFIVSLVSGEWAFWLVIFFFDMAYLGSTKFLPKLILIKKNKK
ncbi:MAG: hypothetical protein WCW13_05985 [archaeon]|jgi:hypothetical protein